MAKKEQKKGYQGFKLDGDTSESRRERSRKELVRAQQNAGERSVPSNASFALSDAEFIAACEKANVKPTQRQASKFRNGYGAAARELGRSRRKSPEAR